MMLTKMIPRYDPNCPNRTKVPTVPMFQSTIFQPFQCSKVPTVAGRANFGTIFWNHTDFGTIPPYYGSTLGPYHDTMEVCIDSGPQATAVGLRSDYRAVLRADVINNVISHD